MVYTRRLYLYGFLLLLAFTLAHIPYITSEPVDHHSWRQVTTAGVARSFYTESADIFHPRIFDRGDKSGITGMEFPLYNYIIFIFIKLFGYADWYGRLISLAFGVLGLFWFWRYASLELGETAGFLSAFVLSVSPLYFYFSRNIQPDIPMLAMLIGSFYFMKTWELDGKSSSFWLACVSFTIAVLMKLPAIVFLPFFIIIMLSKEKGLASKRIGNYLFIIIPIIISGAWYLYSSYLVTKYNLQYFYLGGDLKDSLSYLLKWKFYQTVILSRLPEIVANFATIPFFVAELVLLKRIQYGINIIALLILCIPYYIIGGYHLYVHDYYSLPIAPVVALIAGGGAWFLLRKAGKVYRIITIILLILAPIIGIARAGVWYKPIYSDFLNTKDMVENNVPQNSLMIAAWRVDPTLLFFTSRYGWSMPPEEVNVDSLHQRGAEYLITTAAADSSIPYHYYLKLISVENSLRLYKFSSRSDDAISTSQEMQQ